MQFMLPSLNPARSTSKHRVEAAAAEISADASKKAQGPRPVNSQARASALRRSSLQTVRAPRLRSLVLVGELAPPKASTCDA